ncbi:Zinc finger, BED-type [Sesbania bispinosa]|nr:Zinc finger, BED-type [Sesbania bispinosa]
MGLLKMSGKRRSKGKQLMDERNVSVNLTPLRSLGYVDPGWEHGVAQDERKKKVKCNYCEKVVSGGINRFKQHLARIPGEVAPCKSAPEEVYLKIKENMKWHRTGRRHRRPEGKEMMPFYAKSDNEDDEYEQVEDTLHHINKETLIDVDKRFSKDLIKTFKGMSPPTGPEPVLRKSRLDNIYLKLPKNQTPQTYKHIKAADSQYFYKMLEMVGQFGQGLVCPPSQLISGRFLQEEINSIKNYLVEYKASWAITGCSIMADCWRDTQVDATNVVEDAPNLFKLLDKVVEEIGEENVVQVITENTPGYKAAGKMLEEKRRNLFWTPCATYCINRMLEDFLKIRCVEECMEKGQKITKLIYNQLWLLNLMKSEFTEGQELLKPAGTQYASSFATLQSLLDHRVSLRRMFLSNKWISSRFSSSSEGKEVEKIVLNVTFWKKMQYVRKSVDPIMHVLQKVCSGESLSMPYIYNEMYRAKLAIKSVHGDDARKYEPFWKVIDSHWNSLFCHPLYLAAYFLNPSYRYRQDFVAHSEVVRGLNECIVRLEPDNMRRISASMQISQYNSAQDDFGTDLAISTRTGLEPAAWWQQHGISCLELQRIAVRILSQTCSSFVCEHDWSIYDQIYSKRQNRLSQKKLNDIIYVHYNLRLRECQVRKRSRDSKSTSVDSVMQEHILNDWIVDTNEQSSDGDKGSHELVTMADVAIGTPDANIDAATDDESDLNYFDDDFSE